MEKFSKLSENRINLKDVIPLEKPFTILLEPTNICNLKCSFCFQTNEEFRLMKKGIMKWDNFKKIVDDLSIWEDEKIKVIRIIGFGEPTLHYQLNDMVRYLKKMDVMDRLEMTSNCYLLFPLISQGLIDAELDYLRVSIYNINNTSVINNLTELKRQRGDKQKPFIYIKMLDSGKEINKHFLETYTNLADEVAVEPIHTWLEGKENFSICPQPFKMLSIRFNGDVISCDPDWKNHTKVGNALKTNIKDIWNGEPLKEFWKMQLEHRRSENASCRNCSFVDNEFYVKDRL